MYGFKIKSVGVQFGEVWGTGVGICVAWMCILRYVLWETLEICAIVHRVAIEISWWVIHEK